MKKYGKNQKEEDDKNRISERVVQYIDDPENSSALAKIHEMSNKAKRSGKSPVQFRRSYIKNLEKNNKTNNKKEDDDNFNRRNKHFATVKQENVDLLNRNKKRNVKPTIETKTDKREFVWDKSINRLVERKIPSNTSNIKRQPYVPKTQTQTQTQKYESKIETNPKRKYINEAEPIKEDKDKEEKGEIIDKLKEYQKKRELEGKNKKRIKIQVPKGNEKFSEIVYEKKVLPEEEDDEDLKESTGSKNSKFYKKIVKNAPGSKTVITKKIIEENIEGGDKLKFDNDSSDDEDLRNELRKLKLNPGQLSKGNVKVKIISEEYDEKGNKIYSKEFTTTKLPKGLKGNDEIFDEFEKFEGEFDDF